MKENKINRTKNYFNRTIKTSVRNKDKLELGIERYVGLGESINLWKKAFYSLLIFSFVLLGTTTYLFISKSKVNSYLIKVNDSGELLGTEKLTDRISKVSTVEIEYFSKKFIKNIRTITKEKKIFDNSLKEASYFLVPETNTKVKSFLSNERVNNFIGNKYTRDIEILSFNQVTDIKDTYQIRWKEREYNEAGKLIKIKNMNAILTTKLFRPTVEQMVYNPFGILIVDLNIIEEN